MTDGQETTGRWRQWLDRHGPAMLLLARQIVPARSDAEDVVQEEFVRFLTNRQLADDPAAYLFACVLSAALDWRRAGARRGRREEEAAARQQGPDAGRAALFTAGMEQEERQAAIEAALAKLPEAQREVLVMKVWAKLTFPQIGQALGIPADTAASRYRYAGEKLRGELAEELIR
jgi:RNA polymerase sigma-70 factor (ECF subfamily)